MIDKVLRGVVWLCAASALRGGGWGSLYAVAVSGGVMLAAYELSGAYRSMRGGW
jgi:hypothetical protein